MRYKVLCGYIRQRWDCGDTVEIEEKHTGKYGAAGQIREKKRKAWSLRPDQNPMTMEFLGMIVRNGVRYRYYRDTAMINQL